MFSTPMRYFLIVLLKFLQLHGFYSSIPYYFKKHQKCPPITSDLLLIPASVLADKIRKKEISSTTVIKAYIQRVKEVNPIVNAVVDERFEAALQDAKNIDNMLAETKLSVDQLKTQYPLLGLPITVKESIATTGLSWTSGRLILNRKKAERDATAIAKIKNAGGIVLLVSNVPELCISGETYNNATGRTLNPYDTRRTPSGSSGGEAALISSGASLLGVGSDLFGSVRLPAHHCGIWGHKPTTTSVAINGHYPGIDKMHILEKLTTLGPMCRYGGDLRLLLSVMIKDEAKSTLKLNDNVDLKKIKVFYADLDDKSILTNPIDTEIGFAIQKFCSFMRNTHQCEVEQLQIEELKVALEVAMISILDKIKDCEDLYPDKNIFKEMVLYLLGKSNSVFTALMPSVLRPTAIFFPKSYFTEPHKIIANLKDKLSATLGSNGILVFPCHPTPAHRHGRFAERLYDYAYAGLFNCLGFPVTCCPFGFNSEGLPIGIQIVSTVNNDRICFAVAEAIEKEIGGWIPPEFA